jgi:hypothetical protein
MRKDSIFAHSRRAFGPSPKPPARLTIPVSQYALLMPLKCYPYAYLMVDLGITGVL